MTAALSSSVMPVTGITYELVHDHTAGVGVAKRSPGGKATRPGIKQAYRLSDHDLNLNVHFHALVPEGVLAHSPDGGLSFHFPRGPRG